MDQLNKHHLKHKCISKTCVCRECAYLYYRLWCDDVNETKVGTIETISNIFHIVTYCIPKPISITQSIGAIWSRSLGVWDTDGVEIVDNNIEEVLCRIRFVSFRFRYFIKKLTVSYTIKYVTLVQLVRGTL